MNKVNDNAPHILIVDDDERILELLSQYLKEQGFKVSMAQNAKLARDKLRSIMFDLLIVDVMMPEETGTDFTVSLRKQTDVPILMLTALGEVEARVKGLEAGADDYLAKPFDPRELILRVNGILKRAKQPDEPIVELINFGPYTFSLKQKELMCEGKEIRLTQREKDILFLFAQKAGGVVSREELAGHVLQENERTIDVQINRLRNKIENDDTHPQWLQTVRGIGYRLRAE